ncbi:MAG: DUF4097 family beta strand repeat-containing protein [Candidatus Acidiferrales bacterium]
MGARGALRQRYWRCGVLTLAALLAFASPASAKGKRGSRAATNHSDRLSADKTGQLSTSAGLRLRLIADEGDIRITTHDSPTVDYRVHLEVDSNDSNARGILDGFSLLARNTKDGVLLLGRTPHHGWGQHLSVTFEVAVPRNYNLDISTQGGNVRLGDVQGHVAIGTNGGNISTGEIGGPARLVTDGGHISVKNAGNDLVATTGGGNITVGPVAGTAVLRTGGGHIHVASIGGVGKLETGGGNISLEHSGGGLIVSTGGGQIDVGEVSGLIRARTGGGGIRIVHASGPTELQTSAGNVYLMQVENSVRASTGSGGITAWFGPDAKLTTPCRLAAGEGDIVVYLPKLLPVTVDAQVELGGDHRVIIDPAFPLKVTYGEPDEGSHAVRAAGELNGGGAPLVLRTVSGNIRLVLNDSNEEKHQRDLLKLQMDKLRRQLEMDLANMKIPMPPPPPPQN